MEDYSKGRFPEAITNARELQKLCLTNYGKDHPYFASSLCNVGLVLKEQGQTEAAKPLYEQALVIYQRSLGEAHQSTRIARQNLAIVHRQLKEFELALPLMAENLAGVKAEKGERSPEAANALYLVAGLKKDLGSLDEAENLYLEALNILLEVYGDEHASVATCMNNMGVFYKVPSFFLCESQDLLFTLFCSFSFLA